MNSLTFFVAAIAFFLASQNAVEASKLNNSTLLGGSATTNVHIIIVIDTETLLEKYPNPSKDPNNPTGISHNFAFMVAPTKYVQDKQATADLILKSIAGDNIYWWGTTESNNFETQIIVYNLKYPNSDIISPPRKSIKRQASCMEIVDQNIANAMEKKCNYVSITAEAQNDGKLAYDVHFALYVKDRYSGGSKKLIGYFWWDPVIYVGRV